MKICGFTIVRNGVKFDYPFAESIRSLLPIVDKLVINYGVSEDETLAVLKSIMDPKIEIFQAEWDLSMREGGKLLSYETNRALKRCQGDWGFYLQADEVLHEDEYNKILQDLEKAHKRGYEAVSFRYIHFEATYNLYNPFRYRREIRAIRLGRDIVSWGDAATFRKSDGRKPRVLASSAHIYHYGWVKDPRSMQQKQENFHKYWHSDKWIQQNIPIVEEFDYNRNIKELSPFLGQHPKVMQKRISEKNWMFNYDISFNKNSLKDKIKKILNTYLGINLEYRNYKIEKLRNTIKNKRY